MFRRFLAWFFTTVIGHQATKKPFFVAVREGRSLSRIEQLPDGTNVFYVDVSDVPPNRVESYLRRAKQGLVNDEALGPNEGDAAC